MSQLSARQEDMTPARRWLLLTTVASGLFLITLDNTILYTALPTLTEELGATGSQSLWIINAYPVVMAGLILGSGTFGDRAGHVRMFLLGLVVFGLASLAAAFSPTAGILIATRVLLAVGAAIMMPATLALIRITFTRERERNFAIAIWGSISVIGIAVGPIVGGALLEFFWWGSVFLLNVPIVLIALVATLVIAPPNRPDPGKHWDLISSLQAMAGLVAGVLAIKEIGNMPPNPWVIALAVAVAGIAFTLFVRRQKRLSDPLLDFAIFRNPAFSAGVLTAVLAMFAIGGIQLVTTQRYQLVAGFSPLESGLLVAALAAGSLPTALLGGAVLHRTGLLPLIAGGLGVATVGVVTTIAGFHLSFPALVAGMVLTGAGLGAAMSVASVAIVGNAPSNRAGMASAVEEVSYEFGNLSAVALLGSLLTFVYSATVQLPAHAPDRAGQSLADALAVVGNDAGLLSAAYSAFDTAYLVVMVAVTLVLAVGAAVTGGMLRRHGPGSSSQHYIDH